MPAGRLTVEDQLMLGYIGGADFWQVMAVGGDLRVTSRSSESPAASSPAEDGLENILDRRRSVGLD